MTTPDRHGIRHRFRERLRPQGVTGAEGIFSARFVMGVAIIAIGALFLFDSLGLIEARDVLRSAWPLILVVVGIVLLSRPTEGRRRNEGWAFIAVGLWIFLSNIGLFDLSFWGILFPVLLLFVGALLVYRSLVPPPAPPKIEAPGAPGPAVVARREPSVDADDARAQSESFASREQERAEYIRTFALLSSAELRPKSRPFRGADLSAVLGGVNLDLTSARMEGDSARIEVFAFCGGIEIHVPPDWAVTSKVATLLSGFSDKRRPTTVAASKTLIVDGFAIMGGIEVKN